MNYKLCRHVFINMENMFDNIWHLICLHLISGFILCFILWIDFSNRTKELQMRNCVKAETYNKLFGNIDRVSGKLFTFISHTDQHRHETPIQFEFQTNFFELPFDGVCIGFGVQTQLITAPCEVRNCVSISCIRANYKDCVRFRQT